MKEKLISALSYLWILFFLPLVLIPNSSFGRFHANQALINLIFSLAAWLVTAILGGIPILGAIIRIVLRVAVFILVLWGVVTALMGEQKPYPFIGGIKIIG